MSVSIIPSLVSLPQSPFPPLAVGFMGLGTGYLIYGTEELRHSGLCISCLPWC
jgi:hypothetical protein